MAAPQTCLHARIARDRLDGPTRQVVRDQTGRWIYWTSPSSALSHLQALSNGHRAVRAVVMSLVSIRYNNNAIIRTHCAALLSDELGEVGLKSAAGKAEWPSAKPTNRAITCHHPQRYLSRQAFAVRSSPIFSFFDLASYIIGQHTKLAV